MQTEDMTGGTMGCAADMPEAMRLSFLSAHQPDSLVDDPELQRLTSFAARLCDAPIALVSLVEDDRQRFLAREGLEASQTERRMSFCQHAMTGPSIMQVPDALEDPRFAHNELVTGEPRIRFYAGAPLVSDEGAALGSLCIISPDPRPQGLDDFQAEGLAVLAQAVMRRLKDRRAHHALKTSTQRFEALGDAMPQMAWSTPPDGKTDYFNARWYEFTGAAPEEHYGSGWLDALHPDDRALTTEVWDKAVATGEPYEVEYRLRRADGQYRWTLARGLPMRNEAGEVVRWFGTNTDIDDYRRLIEARDLLSRELSHRIKNIFSVVSGLIRMESRSTPALEPIANAISERIASLGRAHDYVRPQGTAEDPASLHGVLSQLFAPYGTQDAAKVQIEGVDLSVSPHKVTPVALLFHELATNAAKYGALSSDGGAVRLNVQRIEDELVIDWHEHGGPKLGGEREMTGFGSQLVDMSVRRHLRGRHEMDWAEDGLKIRIILPSDALD